MSVVDKAKDILSSKKKTKILPGYGTILEDKIEIRQSKGYYVFLMLLGIGILGGILFRTENGELEILIIIRDKPFWEILLLLIPLWAIGLSIYRIRDNGVKLRIDRTGIFSHNLIGEISETWENVSETYIEYGRDA